MKCYAILQLTLSTAACQTFRKKLIITLNLHSTHQINVLGQPIWPPAVARMTSCLHSMGWSWRTAAAVVKVTGTRSGRCLHSELTDGRQPITPYMGVMACFILSVWPVSYKCQWIFCKSFVCKKTFKQVMQAHNSLLNTVVAANLKWQ